MIVKRVQQNVRGYHRAHRQPPFDLARKKRSGAECQPVKRAEIRRKQPRPARQRGHQHEQIGQRLMPVSFHNRKHTPLLRNDKRQRSADIPVRNNVFLTAKAENPGRAADRKLLRTGMSALRRSDASTLQRFNAPTTYLGSNSLTSAFSSFNSFTVASIFPRLNSLIGSPCTISKLPP